MRRSLGGRQRMVEDSERCKSGGEVNKRYPSKLSPWTLLVFKAYDLNMSGSK